MQIKQKSNIKVVSKSPTLFLLWIDGEKFPLYRKKEMDFNFMQQYE